MSFSADERVYMVLLSDEEAIAMYDAGPACFANHIDGFDPKILEHLEPANLQKT